MRVNTSKWAAGGVLMYLNLIQDQPISRIAGLFACCTALALLTACQTSEKTPWKAWQADLKPGTSTSAIKATLPDNVQIVAPSADVPKELSAFSGIWHGWMCRDRVCDTKLAVEKLRPNGGTIVYAFGSEQLGTFRERMPATFANSELKATTSYGTSVTYRMRPDGNLDMYWQSEGSWMSGILSKASDS